jgi:hypothetical protein
MKILMTKVTKCMEDLKECWAGDIRVGACLQSEPHPLKLEWNWTFGNKPLELYDVPKELSTIHGITTSQMCEVLWNHFADRDAPLKKVNQTVWANKEIFRSQ